MQLLPDLGLTNDTKDWSDAQIWSFAICTYLIIALYIITTAIAMHNFVVFVIRGRKCHIAEPLFGFYVLAMLTLVADSVYSLFIVKTYVYNMVLLLLLPPTFKFLSGVEQVQLMVELIFGLKIEVQLRQTPIRYELALKRDKIEKSVKLARLIVLIFVCLAIISACTVGIYVQVLNEDERAHLIGVLSTLFGWIFIIEFVVLMILLTILMTYLFKKKKIVN